MSLLTDLDRAAMLDSKRRLAEAFAIACGTMVGVAVVTPPEEMWYLVPRAEKARRRRWRLP